MSVTRKRSCVSVWFELLVKRRRMLSVPSGAFGPTQVRQRTAFGAAEASADGSIRDSATSVRAAGDATERDDHAKPAFSGPGAPRTDCAEPYEPPVVETKTKSAALSFVSCGLPSLNLRTKLYCPSALPIGSRPSPSRKSWLVTELKPTASTRFAGVKFAGLFVLNRATPPSSGLSKV